MTDHLDRRVLRALQMLVLGLPLFLGGRQPLAVAAASVLVLGLLALALRERRRRGEAPGVPGAGALAGFAGVVLLTTVPLPPSLLRVLSPWVADLYARMLPGWPGEGGWSVWRALALDPWGAWLELNRLSIGIGVFAVVLAWPWAEGRPDESGRALAAERLVLTMLASGTLLAALGLLAQALGNGQVLWVTDSPATPGRASGPFVNPNHFAAWLEMVIPVALAFAVALVGRVGSRLRGSMDSAQRMGVQRRRAWVTALVVHQQRLWAPLVALAALLLMLTAHLASGSRGGTAALLAGLAVTAGGVLARRSRAGRRRWAPIVLTALLLAGGAASVVAWALTDAEQQDAAAESSSADVSLGSRLAVAVEGSGIIRDNPVLGTGLGSWLHAFRPYVQPPVEGGIWDHAHNDYLELAAETGAVGCLLMVLFAVATLRAIRGRRRAAGAKEPRLRREAGMPHGFEPPEWRATLREASAMRWGLAGALVAILVHSGVDFSLHMPANLLLAMLVLALVMLLGARVEPRRQRRSLVALLLLLGVPLLLQAANLALTLAGSRPLDPHDCLAAADLMLAEEKDAARDDALALLHRAIDRAPADREAHEALADALGPGPDGDEALRRALALEPWSAELRDQLGLRLLAHGEVEAGAAELEESMRRFPYLVSHAYLSPELESRTPDAARLVRALAEGDTMVVRLASLDPPTIGAVERGLRRALEEAPVGPERTDILSDLVTLLEARERWSDAAAALAAEAGHGIEGGPHLARAARDYLKAHEPDAAEQTMLAAVLRMPEDGDLYRNLAVDVYAARGDFPMAESVLKAGERNAVDMLPVYDGVTQVLTQRESTRVEDTEIGPKLPLTPEEMVP